MKQMMLPKIYFPLFVLCLLLTLAGCNGNLQDTVDNAPTVLAEADEATPTESPLALPQASSPLVAQADSPLASTQAAALPEVERPEPVTSETTGAAVGQVLIAGAEGVRPATQVYVALAALIADKEGVPRVAGYDAAAAPRELTLEDGSFVISDVPTGTYGIILDAVLTSVLLNEPGTERSLLIEIKAGEVTDVGTLEYESLGLPGMSD